MIGKLRRVKYNKSPLIEVIFQLRFPTILSIATNEPANFQERIREEYPLFSEQLQEYGDVALNPQIKTASMRKIGETKIYSFMSADKKKKISLTPFSLAISTKSYTLWEEFAKCIDSVVPIFEEIYKPAFYNRIGLRYVDLITRSKLGLDSEKWTDLIKPHILGMSAGEYEDGVQAYLSEIEYQTKEKDVLSRAHFEFVRVNSSEEKSLLIDCDYYALGQIKLGDVNIVSKSLHNASSSFIQEAIQTKLYDAMLPEEIKL